MWNPRRSMLRWEALPGIDSVTAKVAPGRSRAADPLELHRALDATPTIRRQGRVRREPADALLDHELASARRLAVDPREQQSRLIARGDDAGEVELGPRRQLGRREAHGDHPRPEVALVVAARVGSPRSALRGPYARRAAASARSRTCRAPNRARPVRAKVTGGRRGRRRPCRASSATSRSAREAAMSSPLTSPAKPRPNASLIGRILADERRHTPGHVDGERHRARGRRSGPRERCATSRARSDPRVVARGLRRHGRSLGGRRVACALS